MQKKVMFLIGFALLQAISLFAQPQPTQEVVWLKLKDDYREQLGRDPGYIINAVFAPDDRTIIVTHNDPKDPSISNIVTIEFSVLTGDFIREITNIKGIFKFSKDGQFAYTFDWKKVRWPSMEVVGEFKDADKPIFIPDNSIFGIDEKAGVLITAGDQIISIFDINTFNLKSRVKLRDNNGNAWSFYRIEVPEDGHYFLTRASYTVQHPPDLPKTYYSSFLWDLTTLDTTTQTYNIKDLGILKASADNRWLASVGGHYVYVFDANTCQKVYEWNQIQSGNLTAVAISPDSRWLAAGGGPSNAHIYDLSNGRLNYTYSTGGHFLRYSNSGNYLLAYNELAVELLNSITTSVNLGPPLTESVLYPNPTTNKITLSNSYFQPGQLRIDLVDLNGRNIKVLYDSLYNKEELKFDLSFLSAGTYIIKATQNNKVRSFKIIKEK